MDSENGTVQRVEGAWAWVLTRRGGACGGCSHKGHCEIVEGGDRMLVKARNADHALPGEEVRVVLPAGTRMKSYVLVYLLPILGLVGGAIVGNRVAGQIGWPTDATAILFALGLMVLLFLLARVVDRRARKRDDAVPLAVRAPKGPESTGLGPRHSGMPGSCCS